MEAMHEKLCAWLFYTSKLLSLMTITRERQSDYPGQETGGCSHTCVGERPNTGVRYLYREHVGSSGIIVSRQDDVFIALPAFYYKTNRGCKQERTAKSVLMSREVSVMDHEAYCMRNACLVKANG